MQTLALILNNKCAAMSFSVCSLQWNEENVARIFQYKKVYQYCYYVK